MSSKSKSPKKILNIDKINKMERNTTEMISKAKSEFVKKINKINNILVSVMKKKKKTKLNLVIYSRRCH